MGNQEDQTPFIHPVYRRDNFKCQYCGRDGLASFDDWGCCTIDHVVPKKHAGTDDESNLVTCCHYCNAIKGQRPFRTLDEARKYVLKRRKELEKEFQEVIIVLRG